MQSIYQQVVTSRILPLLCFASPKSSKSLKHNENSKNHLPDTHPNTLAHATIWLWWHNRSIAKFKCV